MKKIPTTMKKIAESDIAAVIVAWLREKGWQVYQEVRVRRKDITSEVADIVAVCGDEKWAIETKASFGLRVLEQADKLIPYFHRISVGVPWAKNGNFAARVCDKFDIGLLRVDVAAGSRRPVWEVREAPLHKGTLSDLVALNEQQKDFAMAGNDQGKFWTPFQNTKQLLIAAVFQDPGRPLKDYLSCIEHHYASLQGGCSALSKLIREGVIKELVIVRQGRTCVVECQPAYPNGTHQG